MILNKQNQIERCARGQAGYALFTSLMFLVIVTLLGVTMLRLNTMDERMAANLRDQYIAFQSAETALVASERAVRAFTDADRAGTQDGANASRVFSSETDSLAAIEDQKLAWWQANAVEYTDTDPNTYYVVQHMSFVSDTLEPTEISGTDYYRITAWGPGAALQGGSVSVLQSTYSRRFN